MSMTQLDQAHVIKHSYDEATESLKVKGIAGALVTEQYDNLAITYVAAGNGVGEIETVTFKQGSTTVATLTLTYNSDNKLSTVTKS